MLKIDGKIAPGGYVELSESAKVELDACASIMQGERAGNSVEASRRVVQMGRYCGVLVRSSAAKEFVVPICEELTENMEKTIAMDFEVGYDCGVFEAIDREYPI